MNKKTAFCKSLGLENVFPKIEWLDLSGVVQMSDNRVARIDLAKSGDRYKGVTVTVIHKLNGAIDSKTFEFNDYMSRRVDDRSDYKDKFCVIPYVGWDWYIAVPHEEELHQFASAIFLYVDQFEVTHSDPW